MTVLEDLRLFRTNRARWWPIAAERLARSFEPLPDRELSRAWGALLPSTKAGIWPHFPGPLKDRIRLVYKGTSA